MKNEYRTPFEEILDSWERSFKRAIIILYALAMGWIIIPALITIWRG